MNTNELVCTRCGQAPKFCCERCLEPYCSSQCQVADWQQHKANCYKFPNLIPIHILKSNSSYMNSRNDVSTRRQYASNSSISSNNKHRNPVEGGESYTTKQKTLPHDEDFTLMPKASVANAQSVSAAVGCEKPSNWKVAYPPPNDYFEALIQFVEEIEKQNRFIWVTDVKYDAPLRKLLAEINRNVNQKEPCSPDLIFPGALVAAPLNKILYRAEVLECSPDVQRANIRLIDYGNELRLPYSQIFAPIPIMSNLNAYAFRICVPDDCGPLELEAVLTIKVVGEKHPEGYYNVVCKTKSIPLQLPVDALTKEPSLTVVKCFTDGRKALLRLNTKEDIKLDAVLNSEQTIQYEFDKTPNEGTFVAARIGGGWRRACLLACFENGYQFLVYTIDEGHIRLTPQIKRIPNIFLSQAMQVFAVSTGSSDYMLSEAMLTAAKKLSLQLLPATSITAGKDSMTHLSCALFDDTQKIVDVVIASVFTGCFDELGIKLWHDRVEDGSLVYISNVITFKEIYIASTDSKDYAKIFYCESLKRTAFGPDDIIKKDDVVFVCDCSGKSYRGQILLCESYAYKVINVDTGVVQTIERKCLFKPSRLVRSLPVLCTLVKLMFLENIPTPVANNKALAALESCMENLTEFAVSSGNGGGEYQAVDLLFCTTEKQSLCKKLLPMVFEPRDEMQNKPPSDTRNKKCPAPDNFSSPLSPPNTPITTTAVIHSPMETTSTCNVNKKTYTLEDLEIIPIECGEHAELYILDATTLVNIDAPYVTASDFKNKQFLSKMEKYLAKVETHCTGPNALRSGYAPKQMEICLSIFPEDHQWYRAICIEKHPNDTFIVMFLDYGNVSKVTKNDLMPITPDLMFPSNANMVYLEGITTKEQARKFAKATQEMPVIKAKLTQLPDNAYLAEVHQLEKYLA